MHGLIGPLGQPCEAPFLGEETADRQGKCSTDVIQQVCRAGSPSQARALAPVLCCGSPGAPRVLSSLLDRTARPQAPLTWTAFLRYPWCSGAAGKTPHQSALFLHVRHLSCFKGRDPRFESK